MTSNIDTGAILEALNDKVDRDCNYSIPIIPKFTLLYTGAIQKDASITFSNDPSDYDFLIGIVNGVYNILTGKYYFQNNTGRIKLNGLWVGKDAYSGGYYQQTYTCDFAKTSDNTYTCWSAAWSETSTASFTEVSYGLRIFGVKL